MPDCQNKDINIIELSRNSSITEVLGVVHTKGRKRKKHKSDTAKVSPMTIDMQSNRISKSTVHYDGTEEVFIKKSEDKSISRSKRKKNKYFESKEENHPRRKYKCINDTNEHISKIDESANFKKSDINVFSNSSHKMKRKHSSTNAENVSELRIAEGLVQEFENNASMNSFNSMQKLKKKEEKHNLFCKMGNTDIYQEPVTYESGRNKILDVLHAYKGKDKHKETEVDKITTDSNATEISQNSLNNGTLNRFHKKKKHKFDKIKNISDCNILESSLDNSGTNVILDVHKKMDNHEKTDLYNRLDLKTADSSIIEIDKNGLNNENFPRIRKKKNLQKSKVVNEMDNVLECKITDSNAFEQNQNVLNSEILNGVSKKEKKKHKFNKLENVSDCNIHDKAETLDKLGNNTNFNVLGIDKHEQTIADNRSDYKTVVSNVIELNDNDLNNGNLHRFHRKKKKHKYKMFNETENISNCKIADSNDIPMNQNDFKSEILNKSHKKKKKKYNLIDEKGNLSDCDIQELATAELEKTRIFVITDVPKRIDECNDLNTETQNGSRKKKKFKLLVEKGKLSDCDIQKSATDELGKNIIFDVSDAPKIINKCKQTDDSETIDLNAEINNKNLISDTFGGLHKIKRKKHKHKLPDLENSSKTVIESNNSLNNSMVQEYMKQVKENSIVQNAIDDKSPRINRKSIECFESEVEIILDNLPEKEKKFACERPEKEKNVTCKRPEVKEKRIVQNAADDRSLRIKRKSNECFESEVEIILDNLPGKEKNVTCKRPEKEMKDTCKSPKKQKIVAGKSPEKEKNYQDEDSYISFDSYVFNMADVPVPFIVPALHEGETAATLLPEQKEYLEKNGVTIRTGKWTKTEDDILIRNFLKFGFEFGVNNPFQLLGINQSKKNEKLSKFLNAKHFLVRLGKDLNDRSLRSIYMRARKLFNPLKNKEKLSIDEASELKHAHQLVGNKWTRISDMLSRSADNCHTAYRWHKSDISKGRWKLDEERDLIKAIKTVSGAEDISANNVKNISWKEVAKYVPTRNEFQCQKQWANHLAWDSSVTEKKSWQKCHYGKLIYLIRDKYCFNSESEINFKELHKYFSDVAPSYIFLRKKWLYMKGRIAKDLNLSYGRYLDTLMRMYRNQYKIFVNEETLNS